MTELASDAHVPLLLARIKKRLIFSLPLKDYSGPVLGISTGPEGEKKPCCVNRSGKGLLRGGNWSSVLSTA